MACLVGLQSSLPQVMRISSSWARPGENAELDHSQPQKRKGSDPRRCLSSFD